MTIDKATFERKVTDFEQTYERLVARFQRISTADAATQDVDDWSPRAGLAQLAGWLEEAQRRYPRYARGTAHFEYNVDGLNAVYVRMRRDRTYPELLSEVQTRARQLSTAARALTVQQIERHDAYADWLDMLQGHAQRAQTQLGAFLNEGT